MKSEDEISDLVVEEYKSCRSLIEKHIEIIEKTEIYVVGAIALVVVACLSSKVSHFVLVSSMIPLLLSAIGFSRFLGLNSTLNTIDAHLKEVEQNFPNINWATYYATHRTNKLLVSRCIVWGFLILGSASFAYYVWHVTPDYLASQARKYDNPAGIQSSGAKIGE